MHIPYGAQYQPPPSTAYARVPSGYATVPAPPAPPAAPHHQEQAFPEPSNTAAQHYFYSHQNQSVPPEATIPQPVVQPNMHSVEVNDQSRDHRRAHIPPLEDTDLPNEDSERRQRNASRRQRRAGREHDREEIPDKDPYHRVRDEYSERLGTHVEKPTNREEDFSYDDRGSRRDRRDRNRDRDRDDDRDLDRERDRKRRYRDEEAEYGRERDKERDRERGGDRDRERRRRVEGESARDEYETHRVPESRNAIHHAAHEEPQRHAPYYSAPPNPLDTAPVEKSNSEKQVLHDNAGAEPPRRRRIVIDDGAVEIVKAVGFGDAARADEALRPTNVGLPPRPLPTIPFNFRGLSEGQRELETRMATSERYRPTDQVHTNTTTQGEMYPPSHGRASHEYSFQESHLPPIGVSYHRRSDEDLYDDRRVAQPLSNSKETSKKSASNVVAPLEPTNFSRTLLPPLPTTPNFSASSLSVVPQGRPTSLEVGGLFPYTRHNNDPKSKITYVTKNLANIWQRLALVCDRKKKATNPGRPLDILYQYQLSAVPWLVSTCDMSSREWLRRAIQWMIMTLTILCQLIAPTPNPQIMIEVVERETFEALRTQCKHEGTTPSSEGDPIAIFSPSIVADIINNRVFWDQLSTTVLALAPKLKGYKRDSSRWVAKWDKKASTAVVDNVDKSPVHHLIDSKAHPVEGDNALEETGAASDPGKQDIVGAHTQSPSNVLLSANLFAA